MNQSLAWLTVVVAVSSGCGFLSPAKAAEPVTVKMPTADASRERCHAHLDSHAKDPAATAAEETERFMLMAERALVYRQVAIAEANRLQARIDARLPLSGSDLEVIHEGTRDYLAMRERLWAVAEAHECWLELPAGILQQHGITVRQRGDAIMLSLAAALLLYDNYLLTASLFDQRTGLRRVLNRPDLGYALPRHRLTEVKLSFLSHENYERIAAAIRYFRSEVEPTLDQQDTAERAYLAQLIAQSPSYAALRANRMPANLLHAFSTVQVLSIDLLNGMSRDGLNLFSMVFGNTVGLVETRKGRLYRQREVERALAAELQPGDILLEKTPFRLTDLMIPGYWGHVAIWVGTEPELRALGVWDHPAVRPHHRAIRQGKRIVEALRPGVTINSLAQFLNVDDLAVLRTRWPDPEVQAARVVRAFRQLGKAYDFNFDVETTDRIVCSELVYQVYTELIWPTSRQLGRATISPDQVAMRALPGEPLRVVTLYDNGRLVSAEPDAHMKVLLGRTDRKSPSTAGSF